jgi:hypothetical protein
LVLLLVSLVVSKVLLVLLVLEFGLLVVQAQQAAGKMFASMVVVAPLALMLVVLAFMVAILTLDQAVVAVL